MKGEKPFTGGAAAVIAVRLFVVEQVASSWVAPHCAAEKLGIDGTDATAVPVCIASKQAV